MAIAFCKLSSSFKVGLSLNIVRYCVSAFDSFAKDVNCRIAHLALAMLYCAVRFLTPFYAAFVCDSSAAG